MSSTSILFDGSIIQPVAAANAAVNGRLIFNSATMRFRTFYPNGNNDRGYINIESNVCFSLILDRIDVSNAIIHENQASGGDVIERFHVIVVASNNFGSWSFPEFSIDVTDSSQLASIAAKPAVSGIQTAEFIPEASPPQTIDGFNASGDQRLNTLTKFNPTFGASGGHGTGDRCYLDVIVAPAGPLVPGSRYSYGFDIFASQMPIGDDYINISCTHAPTNRWIPNMIGPAGSVFWKADQTDPQAVTIGKGDSSVAGIAVQGSSVDASGTIGTSNPKKAIFLAPVLDATIQSEVGQNFLFPKYSTEGGTVIMNSDWIGGSDDGHVIIDLGPNKLLFLGTAYGQVFLNANGTLSLRTNNQSPDPQLTSAFDVPQVLFYWDDLDPGGNANGRVSYKIGNPILLSPPVELGFPDPEVTESTQNPHLLITFEDVACHGQPGSIINLQVAIRLNAELLDVEIVYGDMFPCGGLNTNSIVGITYGGSTPPDPLIQSDLSTDLTTNTGYLLQQFPDPTPFTLPNKALHWTQTATNDWDFVLDLGRNFSARSGFTFAIMAQDIIPLFPHSRVLSLKADLNADRDDQFSPTDMSLIQCTSDNPAISKFTTWYNGTEIPWDTDVLTSETAGVPTFFVVRYSHESLEFRVWVNGTVRLTTTLDLTAINGYRYLPIGFHKYVDRTRILFCEVYHWDKDITSSSVTDLSTTIASEYS